MTTEASQRFIAALKQRGIVVKQYHYIIGNMWEALTAVEATDRELKDIANLEKPLTEAMLQCQEDGHWETTWECILQTLPRIKPDTQYTKFVLPFHVPYKMLIQVCLPRLLLEENNDESDIFNLLYETFQKIPGVKPFILDMPTKASLSMYKVFECFFQCKHWCPMYLEQWLFYARTVGEYICRPLIKNTLDLCIDGPRDAMSVCTGLISHAVRKKPKTILEKLQNMFTFEALSEAFAVELSKMQARITLLKSKDLYDGCVSIFGVPGLKQDTTLAWVPLCYETMTRYTPRAWTTWLMYQDSVLPFLRFVEGGSAEEGIVQLSGMAQVLNTEYWEAMDRYPVDADVFQGFIAAYDEVYHGKLPILEEAKENEKEKEEKKDGQRAAEMLDEDASIQDFLEWQDLLGAAGIKRPSIEKKQGDEKRRRSND